jgi:hypothetical protein
MFAFRLDDLGLREAHFFFGLASLDFRNRTPGPPPFSSMNSTQAALDFDIFGSLQRETFQHSPSDFSNAKRFECNFPSSFHDGID